MILRNATIQYSGNDPNLLNKGSHKRVCISCDGCNRVRWIEYRRYTDLCHLCANRKKLRNQLPKPKFVPESERFLNGTQIDRILTIEKFGYDPADLKENSGRKVIVICQNCDKIREIDNDNYRNLCYKCSKLGENNPHWGKFGKESPNWKGGISGNREHVKHIRDCIKLNSYFEGSNFHHIMCGVGIYIRGYLHKFIWHTLKQNKQGMKEINELSLNYLIGDIK